MMCVAWVTGSVENISQLCDLSLLVVECAMQHTLHIVGQQFIPDVNADIFSE